MLQTQQNFVHTSEVSKQNSNNENNNENVNEEIIVMSSDENEESVEEAKYNDDKNNNSVIDITNNLNKYGSDEDIKSNKENISFSSTSFINGNTNKQNFAFFNSASNSNINLLPTKIQIPYEHTRELDENDKKLLSILTNKYNDRISELSFFPKDISIRFVLGFKYIEQQKRQSKNKLGDAAQNENLTLFEERCKTTYECFEKYLSFHKQYHYDDILTNPQFNNEETRKMLENDEYKACPYFIYGVDKQGHPILFDQGTANPDKIFNLFNNNDMRLGLFRARIMRKVHDLKLELSNYYGFTIYQHSIIMDLSSLNVTTCLEEIAKNRKFHEKSVQDLSQLFPEVIYKLYLINTPLAFRLLWKLLKTIVDPITASKIVVLSDDYIHDLKKDISLNMLPPSCHGNGIWDIQPGDIPLNFPFKANSI